MEYMHSTAVPPPEVTTEYIAVPAGYILFCYALLIEDTPLLVDGLTMEWFNQSDGSSLGKTSGTSITVLSDGRRRLFINHKPQLTSHGGVYTCQVSLSSENMFIALQQPTVKNVIHTVIVNLHMYVCMCVCEYNLINELAHTLVQYIAMHVRDLELGIAKLKL